MNLELYMKVLIELFRELEFNMELFSCSQANSLSLAEIEVFQCLPSGSGADFLFFSRILGYDQ